jgi:hypothetical protein
MRRDIMTDKEYNYRLREARRVAADQKRRNEIRDIRESNRREPKFKIQTTKLIIIFIFLNCTVVEGYSMWVMYKLMDLSALYTLITAVVGETIAFAVYAAKSYKETYAEEQLKFEKDKLASQLAPVQEEPEPDDIPINTEESGPVG